MNTVSEFIANNMIDVIKFLACLCAIAAALGAFALFLHLTGTGQHEQCPCEYESQHTPFAELADNAQMVERFDCLKQRVDVIRPKVKP